MRGSPNLAVVFCTLRGIPRTITIGTNVMIVESNNHLIPLGREVILVPPHFGDPNTAECMQPLAVQHLMMLHQFQALKQFEEHYRLMCSWSWS